MNMTRDEIIKRIFQNSGIDELGEVPFGTSPVENLEDYPYSLPSSASDEFNVPSGGSVGAVGAQSYGGRRGGGFGFPMLPNLSGSQPESAEEFADEYANEYAQELAESAADSAAESAAERARKAERDRQAVQEIKEQSADITFEKPQIKTDFEQIRARGADAVEQMRKQGEILRGERLSAEQMSNAPEAQQMQFGRFADTAQTEQAVRRANPNADAQQIKAKAEEIAEKSRSSAEPIKQEDLQITYKDLRTPQLERIKETASGTFGRNQTQVAVSGRDFSDVNAIKNYERNIQGVSSVSPNEPIEDKRNVFHRAFDYMTKTARESAENPLIGLGAYGLAAPALAALPVAAPAAVTAPAAATASNVLSFPTAAKVATAASTIGGTVLKFPTSAAAERTNYNFSPVQWNPGTRTVDAITSAAPKIASVSAPSISSGVLSAAERVVNKLNQNRTNTQKLTTKEKRLGGL